MLHKESIRVFCGTTENAKDLQQRLIDSGILWISDSSKPNTLMGFTIGYVEPEDKVCMYTGGTPDRTLTYEEYAYEFLKTESNANKMLKAINATS